MCIKKHRSINIPVARYCTTCPQRSVRTQTLDIKVLFQYAFTLLLLFNSLLVYAQSPADDYAGQWKRVHQFELQGLPKSAAAVVDSVYAQAQATQNSPQRIKALVYQAKFLQTLEEDAQLTIVEKFRQEIAQSSFPEKQILESMLAHLYWQYFQQNRWQFYNRTRTTATDTVDFRTWDLQTLFAEIHWHFQYSLQQQARSQQTDLQQFRDILEEAAGSKTFQPTLYDFLARQALDFYQKDETTITQPADKFTIDDAAYFGDFSNLTIAAKDTLSLQYNALQIYQSLLLFHAADQNAAAFVMTDLERLDFVYNHATLPDKDTLYLEALQQLKAQHREQEIATSVDFAVASFYQQLGNKYQPGQPQHRWKKKEALALCREAISRFPKSTGAKNCTTLMQEILSKTLDVTIESHISINKPSRLLVTYQNISHLFFKVYKLTPKQAAQFNDIYNDSARVAFIKALPVARTWSSPLKNTQDYQRHTTEVLLPKLSQGQYLLVGSPAPTLNSNALYGYQTFQVTNLALVQHDTDSSHTYQVISRNTGQPLAGAQVRLSNLNVRNRYGPNFDRQFTTNKQGRFTFRVNDYYSNIAATVTFNDEQATFGKFYVYENRSRSDDQTGPTAVVKPFLFTDRSIYRPGQPVYFKGILISYEGRQSTIVRNEDVAVYLQDVNGQEIDTLRLKTNDYGSFSGEFVLPTSGLTGIYYLMAKEDFEKSSKLYRKTTHEFSWYRQDIAVEEYKRPKFETAFKPVTETYRLNDTITVQGTAIAFAESNLSDAKVVYRVHRQVQYPEWYYWSRPSGYVVSEPMEITHGETSTNEQGAFSIEFAALPDVSVDREDQPVFRYEVTADVTDISGETRSATTVVNVGYHSLLAVMELPEKIDKTQENHQISLTTKNLNDEPVPAKGTVTIYKLQAPSQVLRKRPWPAPDVQAWTPAAFHELFPHDPYQGEDDPQNQEKGQPVFSIAFDTEQSTKIALPDLQRWESGSYFVELETQDRFGQPVTDKKPVLLYAPQDHKPADNDLFTIRTNKDSYQTGDEVVLKIGSASQDLTVTLDIEKAHRVVQTVLVHLTDTIKEIRIPVRPEDAAGFAVHYSFAAYNMFEAGSIAIDVTKPAAKLEIETLTFRDKLQPGEQQTWSFRIKGDSSQRVAAEVLAGMYDASLDQFRPHVWTFDPLINQKYEAYNGSNADQSFGTNNLSIRNAYHAYNSYIRQQFDQFAWFGFSMDNNAYIRSRYLSSIRSKKYPPGIRMKNDPTRKKGSIYGKITGEDGEPLPGVNVLIQGADDGTITDVDGNYSIKAIAGHVLVFSAVGYRSESATAGKYNTIDVALELDVQALEEVVVVGYGTQNKRATSEAAMPVADQAESDLEMVFEEAPDGESINVPPTQQPAPMPKPNPVLTQIKARQDFKETAFFFPRLTTDKEGIIRFNFTTPEALTRWKLQLLAHTQDLATASKTLQTVTQKALMVLPNPPRFLRAGDTLVFSAKIASLSSNTLTGKAALQLSDALTGQPIDKALGNNTPNQSFTVDAQGNTQVSWRLTIPAGMQAVQYKVVASAGSFSDGEQNVLPVLSNQMLVTETLPLWAGSKRSKTFTLDKLKNNTSNTLRQHQLTLEMTSNPAWYAVQALPYLIEYPYECAEQVFARYYANTLASHIVNAYPKVKAVFDQWAENGALNSKLETNKELKSILVEETPWLRDAQSEAEQKKRIALLFDLHKMNGEITTATQKLQQIQIRGGGFPWFKGSLSPNRYITQHIAAGYGHLTHLGVTKPKDQPDFIAETIRFLDQEIARDYLELLKEASIIREKAKDKREGLRKEKEYLASDHASPIQIHYLYMRSFYQDHAPSKETQKAVAYFQEQATAYWQDNSLYLKGMIALALQRSGNTTIPQAILRSLKENSITSEELGMYWKENQPSWRWQEAPIETQSLMIEAFSEISQPDVSVEERTKTVDALKIWLLKNKQVSQWNTTKATTEAVYALLLQGSDWLSVTELAEVTVGRQKVDPARMPEVKLEAGTGYFKTSWSGEEIRPAMSKVTITTKGNALVWGGLYWQYFENLDKITTASTPLYLDKKLFLKKNTDTGEAITAIDSATVLQTGDLIRVRITLKADRDMDFIHMKDLRAAGLEPVNVLSEYKWQDGLGYYESTKDASTHFFFDHLRKGIYVFEYDLRVNNAGDFSNGITTIQSMYAPEFSSHSQGVRLNCRSNR